MRKLILFFLKEVSPVIAAFVLFQGLTLHLIISYFGPLNAAWSLFLLTGYYIMQLFLIGSHFLKTYSHNINWIQNLPLGRVKIVATVGILNVSLFLVVHLLPASFIKIFWDGLFFEPEFKDIYLAEFEVGIKNSILDLKRVLVIGFLVLLIGLMSPYKKGVYSERSGRILFAIVTLGLVLTVFMNSFVLGVVTMCFLIGTTHYFFKHLNFSWASQKRMTLVTGAASILVFSGYISSIFYDIHKGSPRAQLSAYKELGTIFVTAPVGLLAAEATLKNNLEFSMRHYRKSFLKKQPIDASKDKWFNLDYILSLTDVNKRSLFDGVVENYDLTSLKKNHIHELLRRTYGKWFYTNLSYRLLVSPLSDQEIIEDLKSKEAPIYDHALLRIRFSQQPAIFQQALIATLQTKELDPSDLTTLKVLGIPVLKSVPSRNIASPSELDCSDFLSKKPYCDKKASAKIYANLNRCIRPTLNKKDIDTLKTVDTFNWHGAHWASIKDLSKDFEKSYQCR